MRWRVKQILTCEAEDCAQQYMSISMYRCSLELMEDQDGRCKTNWTIRASLVAQSVKTLAAMQETGVQFLGGIEGEDPLAKEMATHSSILAWRIPWIEELQSGGLQSVGLQELDTT